MAILPTTLDRTDRDFDALDARVDALIAAVFPGWTDRSRANFGNILKELPSFIGDRIGYYVERAAREAHWSTAQLMRSMRAGAKLVGYEIPGATAGWTRETFTLRQALAAPLTLQAGTKVSTESSPPIRYQLLADLTIPAGELTATAKVENSEAWRDTFVSTGQPGQAYRLLHTPYLAGSAVPVDALGPFTLVKNFLGSTSADRHAVVTVDENGSGIVRFGDGVRGAVPSGTVNIDYRTGGGAAGRVEAGTLTRLEGGPWIVQGRVAQITVTNAEDAQDAEDAPSIEQIRLLVPASLETIERAVAVSDFEAAMSRLSWVARALCLTSNEEPSIDEGVWALFVVPRGGGVPTQAQLDTVRGLFVPTGPYPCPNADAVRAYPAGFRTCDFEMKVYKRAGVLGPALKAAIRAAFERFFAPTVDRLGNPSAKGQPNPRIDFGYRMTNVDGEPDNTLAFSDLYDIAHDVAGVRKIGDGPEDFLVNGRRNDVVIDAYGFPVLGEVVVIDGDTGQTL